MRKLLNLVFLTVITIGTLILPSVAKEFKHHHHSRGDKNKHSPLHDKSYQKAYLTLNNFQKGGDGGGPSECDNRYHPNTKLIVALSTRWFAKKKACRHTIIIYYPRNRGSVQALVVDECDSKHGYDKEHAGQPPCGTNIVDGSKAVWEALGIDPNKGKVPVKWKFVDDDGPRKQEKKRKKNSLDWSL